MSLGSVIAAPNRITAVTAGSEQLVAIGVDANGAATAWRSTDASTWVASRLPSPPGLEDVQPEGVATRDDLIVVVGGPSGDGSWIRLAAAVKELTGLSDEDLVGLGVTPLPFAASVSGPFGLTLVDLSVDELGLARSDIEALRVGTGSRDAMVWSSTTGIDWTTSTLNGVRSVAVTVTPQSSLLATESGPDGHLAWLSEDGVEWQPVGPVTAASPTRWAERLIGRNQAGLGDLAVSIDGVDWQPINTSSLLPPENQWWTRLIAGGNAHVAAVFDGTPAFPTRSVTPTTPSLTKDGFSLSFEYGVSLVLREGDTRRLSLMAYQGARRGYEANLTDRTITFTDPDSTEPSPRSPSRNSASSRNNPDRPSPTSTGPKCCCPPATRRSGPSAIPDNSRPMAAGSWPYTSAPTPSSLPSKRRPLKTSEPPPRGCSSTPLLSQLVA